MSAHDVTWADNLVDGHRTLPVVLRDLSSATRAIHVALFLFFDDPIGEQIESILKAKARAGVEVHVLLNVEKTKIGDPFSTGEERMMKEDPTFHRDPTAVTPLMHRLREAGVEVLDTELDYQKLVVTGEPEIDTIAKEIRETVRVNQLHIDHRKIVTIDGRVAYCGSANFGAQYLHHHAFDPARSAKDEARARRDAHEDEPWWKWHDGFVRFEGGSVVHALDRAFRERWLLGGGKRFESIEPQPPSAKPRGILIEAAKVVKNEPSSRTNEVRVAFCERIAAAEKTIFIENPYVYHPAIVEALVRAKRARPALRITLIVPARDWNDNEFSQDAQQYHYPAYVDAGIEVFEYQNHFTHLKLATFDGEWSIIGSANLNYRSMEDDKDFEANVVVHGKNFAARIDREVRDHDLRFSKRITSAEVHGRSLHSVRIRTRDPRTLLGLALREL